MHKKNFVSVAVVLGAAVAAAATFTVNYPEGYNIGDFKNATGHYLMLNGDKLLQPKDITLSFGASAVTITNGTGSTLPVGQKGYFQFEIAGDEAGISADAPDGHVVSLHAAEAKLLLIDLGSPATLDADGLWDGVSVGATATTFAVADMKAATANGGVLDVPRNLTVTGSSGADQVCTFDGFDEYDQAISETITASSTSTVQGKKAFKRVVTMSVAAGGTASKTLDVGWGDVLGLPVAVRDMRSIVAELINGVLQPNRGDYIRVPFAATEAEVDAGTSFYACPGFAGNVVDAAVAVGDDVTTGGTITVEIANVAVDGLGLVVANSATAGTIVTDSATADHASTAFTAAQALEIVFPAAFNASGRHVGYVGVKRAASASYGTLVTALDNNTASTATTADVRGTYDPDTACDGATHFALLVRQVETKDLGNAQYAA